MHATVDYPFPGYDIPATTRISKALVAVRGLKDVYGLSDRVLLVWTLALIDTDPEGSQRLTVEALASSLSFTKWGAKRAIDRLESLGLIHTDASRAEYWQAMSPWDVQDYGGPAGPRQRARTAAKRRHWKEA
jgi:hypothetical protein